MSILLLGANGQVGYELHRSMAPLDHVVAATSSGMLPGGAACERVDLADPDALAGVLRRVAPAWIVNAAAYTAVDRAESETDLADRVNAGALAVIGAEAARLDAAVLHFSTDYVFAGNAGRPWRETDTPAPLNAYGRSKLAGEEALRASGARYLILRTAWVYGARGANFLLTMLRLARTRERLAVVGDQRGSPTPARLLAEVAAHLVRDLGRGDPNWGTYHLSAAGETTWHGFATEIVASAHRAGLLARKPEVDAIATSDYPTPAARPAYSVLDCAMLEQTFGLRLPHWRDGLEACIAELAQAARPE